MSESASSEEIYRGRLLTLRVETLAEPAGGTHRFEIVEHPGAVAIVAVRAAANGEPEVLLVRQYRPAVGRALWEIPAGLLNAGERAAPEDAAARELAEETGYMASGWRLLAQELSSPGFSNERITVYLATGLAPAPGRTGGDPSDPSEIASVQWLPLAEALRLTASGEIEDGKTILGLHLASEALTPAARGEGATMAPTNLPASAAVAVRDESLHLESILVEEFKYMAGTAGEAIADRARMFDRYLLLVGGVLLAGVGSISQLGQLGGERFTQPVAIAVLLASALLGVGFFVTLIRLRLAFRGSIIGMNVVKDYYITEFGLTSPKVERIFPWRTATMPKHERIGSVWYLTTHIVALVSSLCFGGAALLALALVGTSADTSRLTFPTNGLANVAALLVAAAAFLLYVSFYARSSGNRNDAEMAQQAADRLGITTTSAEADA